MHRSIFSILTVLLFMAATGTAQAQIKVDKKPAPAVGKDEIVVYRWISYWGVRDDPPNKYPLGFTTHKTEAEAVAAAKAHIARTAGNGDLAVTHYLIEGEPTVRSRMADRAEKAKEILDRLKKAKEAVDKAKNVAKGEESLLKASERKLGDTIKEYKEMVEQSLRQVTEAKKTLTGGVASLTVAKLREVNGLIDQYNREVQGFRAVMDKDGDFRFNPLARVELKDAKNVPDLADTSWVGESDGWVYTFLADGSYSTTSPDGAHTENSKDFKGGTWRRVEGKLLFKDSADREFEMTIKGDRLYGARFGGAYLTRKK